ncbi:MAG: M23 family metallopeptidase [Alphaproteobacteria bacterium]|nr:M23 family metallopeptidase [Alphaproteobacteria bacterium]
MLKSYVKAFLADLATYFSELFGGIASIYTRFFHTRSLIIMSEHKVKHIPINGHVQFVLLSLAIASLSCSTYFTDRFYSVKAQVKEQNITIRSVASDRVDMNFGSVLRPTVLATGRRNAQLSDPMLAMSGPDPKALYAHIAKLEQQVTALKTSNEAIIQHVKEKTANNIDILESIISKTGLDEEELKKVASKTDKPKRAEGGPFIPADMSALPQKDAEQMLSSLDELESLRQIVSKLPLAKPVLNAEPQSPFGHRVDPFTRKLAFHSGLDLSGPAGSKIRATAAGKVIAAERDGAYGNKIDIDHGMGIVTRYGHLSRILVTAGDQVAIGQTIGIQGSTGRSTGAHLHYEVRYKDQPINPKNFLNARRYVAKN